QRFERAGKSHLLQEPSQCGVGGCLVRQRMAAAGIGPEPARVILRRIAPLQKKLAVRVAHQHRDRAMSQSALMRIELAGGADLHIVGIDQDHRIGVGHYSGLPPPNLSLIAVHATWPASDAAEIGFAAAASAGLASCFFRLLANWFMIADAVAWIMPTPRP